MLAGDPPEGMAVLCFPSQHPWSGSARWHLLAKDVVHHFDVKNTSNLEYLESLGAGVRRHS